MSANASVRTIPKKSVRHDFNFHRGLSIMTLMSFLDLVRRRQSCRRYAPTVVSREALSRCIEAARLAPSACNSQPWTFVVIDRDPLRSEVARAAFTGIYAMNKFVIPAPVLVAVVTERSRFAAAMGGKFRGTQFSLMDVGIACEHFVLQAEEEGLGSCWLGWFDEKAVKRLLGLSRREKVDILISIGYPVDGTVREKKRRSRDEMSRFVCDG